MLSKYCSSGSSALLLGLHLVYDYNEGCSIVGCSLVGAPLFNFWLEVDCSLVGAPLFNFWLEVS